MERRTYLHKKYLFKKGFALFTLIFLTGSFSLTAHAEEETDTAGSSLGKEVIDSFNFYELATCDSSSGQWIQDSKGWWYAHYDGSYSTNAWECINGEWYRFDSNGYMVTGWTRVYKKWYYMDENGVRTTGWKLIDGQWYYFNSSGVMQTDWTKINGQWYYFNSNGYWIDNNSYESGSLKGIDVSQWQESIDWTAVKKDGIQFAFIRVAHGSEHKLDTYYNQNMTNAIAAGIPVGVYYYSTATTENQSLNDAQFVIDQLQGYKISYPIVLDLEDSSQKNLSKAQLGRIAKTFFDEIRRAGYEPMLYCNEDWYKNHIDTSYLSRIDLWIARYNYKYDLSIQRNIWQSSCKGIVDGISENVDLDFGFKDYTQYITPRTYSAEGYTKDNGYWVKNNTGWWYCHFDGTYPANSWEYIKGNWYWFNSNGYMVTGWTYINGCWYYMNSSGAMVTGWTYINDCWYYLNSSGAMVTGWIYYNGYWYFMNSSGQMLTNQWISGVYYVKSDGRMAVSQWVDNSRYYVGADGVWIP